MARDQARHGRGTPGAGRWAEEARGRAPLSVGGPGGGGAPLPSTEDILSAGPGPLWDYVLHEDPLVREEAAGSLHLTAEQCAELADPARQPPSVREAVARLPYPGVASRAVRDPSAVVRWLGLQGWDLSGRERAEAEADPDVRRVQAAMAGGPARRGPGRAPASTHDGRVRRPTTPRSPAGEGAPTS